MKTLQYSTAAAALAGDKSAGLRQNSDRMHTLTCACTHTNFSLLLSISVDDMAIHSNTQTPNLGVLPNPLFLAPHSFTLSHLFQPSTYLSHLEILLALFLNTFQRIPILPQPRFWSLSSLTQCAMVLPVLSHHHFH